MKDHSIALSAIETSQTGCELFCNQDIISEKIRNPIIQPSDFGASNVLPSILSDFEIKSMILGKRNLLEIIPPITEITISPITTPSVPPENPRKISSPAMKSFSMSAVNPVLSAVFSSPSCMASPSTNPT